MATSQGNGYGTQSIGFELVEGYLAIVDANPKYSHSIGADPLPDVGMSN